MFAQGCSQDPLALASVLSTASRANAGASRSESCKGTGAGPVRCGGWLLQEFRFLSFPSFSAQRQVSCSFLSSGVNIGLVQRKGDALLPGFPKTSL